MAQDNTLLQELGKMPIFRLSLGSKELFHSNFLEFLWISSPSAFIDLIRELLGDNSVLPQNPKEYELDREKENFDICIYHKKGNSIIYDLILENKVKSIPYKEQLDEYKERIDKRNLEKKRKETKSCPRYLLLSLARDFPDKDVIERTWKVVHYDALKAAIENQVWPSGGSYIKDYCDFIEELDELGGVILNGLPGEYLFQEEDLKAFREERLHDLYIKLRCTSFMLLLKQRLTGRVPVEIRPAGQVRKKDNKPNDKAGVYLNVNVFNSVGQIGALVWTGKENDDIYEVIIQGGQYRHGINQYTTQSKQPKENGKKSKADRDILNGMWNRFSSDEPSKSFLFVTRKGAGYFPIDADQDKGKDGPYDDYDNGYIYRYFKCDGWKVSFLLKYMADDIVDIARKLGIITIP